MIVLVYARLYARALADAFIAIARNVWTLVLPMGLVVAFSFLGLLVAPGGIAGGLALSLAKSAGLSIYTYFVGELVAKNRVSLRDLPTSIGSYFWTWVNLFFVLWIVDILLGPMRLSPDGQRLRTVITIMELVILNAAPEVIYVKRTSGGLDTIGRSFSFLQDNWIEWAIPNALLLGVVWLFLEGSINLSALPWPSTTVPILLGGVLHIAMVFRGYLFVALDTSSHRQRMFRFGQRE